MESGWGCHKVDLLLCLFLLQVKGKVDEISYFSNPPKNSYLPGVFPVDGKGFDKTMDALVSNKLPIDTPDGRKRQVEEVCLILQRAEKAE